jgi:ParB-like chromosome segregation protein Spo0J
MNIEWVKTKDIIPNENNPRILKDDKFKKLVQSIKDFPEMLEIRPIVVNNEMMILGGNMRWKAIQEIGIKEIPIIKAENLTEEQQREFLIKDNVGFGEWDWDALANDFDADDLEDWGLELPKVIDEVEDEPKIDTQKITLEYTPDEYNQVKKALQKIASTPEQAVWKLLEL